MRAGLEEPEELTASLPGTKDPPTPTLEDATFLFSYILRSPPSFYSSHSLAGASPAERGTVVNKRNGPPDPNQDSCWPQHVCIGSVLLQGRIAANTVVIGAAQNS